MKKKYIVTGMSCAACSRRVEKAVSDLDGVESCAVSLLTEEMTVDGDVSAADVISAVEKAGYGAKAEGETEKETGDSSGLTGALRRLVLSCVFLVILMYISMGHAMFSLPIPGFLAQSPASLALAQMLLCIVIIMIHKRFFTSGARAVAHGGANMDTLVALGSGISFAYSVFVLFLMIWDTERGNAASAAQRAEKLYFDSAAMILVLISVGKTLEEYSKGKTTSALKGLMKLKPETAILIENGEEKIIPAKDIRAGDIFAVKPGGTIPADGEITEGRASIDESMLTGESLPAEKAAGDRVYAACVNRDGYILCRATDVGEDMTISKIIKTVSDAALTKAPVARIADKVAGIFVPVVIGIAAIVTVIWLLCGAELSFALSMGISVLVISCPCSLGLATPVAIMVGNGVGARNGILFKTAEALESTGKTKTVIFDKTGTLTSGDMSVGFVEGEDISLLSGYAYSLESASSHPIGIAVKEYFEKEGTEKFSVSDVVNRPGMGIEGTVHEKRIYGGNREFVSEHAIIPDEMTERGEDLSSLGNTVIYFATEEKFLGLISLSDTIREGTGEAVEKIGAMGIETEMLTGDNVNTAKSVASSLGIKRYTAKVLPERKAEIVKERSATGNVMMVGDGINDAPALTYANTGVAIGTGTDIAIDAADVVIVKNGIYDVFKALTIGRKTLLNIYENLFWAFIYNIICIPIAAGALYYPAGISLNPMIGAMCMSLSSICVVANALRLNLIRFPGTEKSGRRAEVYIQGMMCAHCEERIKKALGTVGGVTVESVSHKKKKAIIIMEQMPDEAEMRKAVEEAGYIYNGMKEK